MSQRPSPLFCVDIKSIGGQELENGMATWRAGRLCTALEVFASVWFGVPAVRLVVAQCSPAASLTDDLQLARLARAAAVAA